MRVFTSLIVRLKYVRTVKLVTPSVQYCSDDSWTAWQQSSVDCNHLIHRSRFPVRKMSCSANKSAYLGATLSEVVSVLETIAPTSLAESWDNVGLLVEPSAPHVVQKLMLTNDLTEPVLNEAISANTDMIVSYHPPLFSSIKRLSGARWKDRIVVRAVENRLAIYSPHTACDAVAGGVNDWLIEPFQGQKQSLTPDPDPTCGMGRICQLSSPLSISNVVEIVKKHLSILNVRIGLNQVENSSIESMVSSIAVCAGSGSSVLRGVSADLYITGEMSHHEVLDAVSTGHTVILCEHSNTERGYLGKLRNEIDEKLGQRVNVLMSKIDSDPLSMI